jgi:hypothetical protein
MLSEWWLPGVYPGWSRDAVNVGGAAVMRAPVPHVGGDTGGPRDRPER